VCAALCAAYALAWLATRLDGARGGRIAIAALCALTVALTIGPIRFITMPRTIDLEYQHLLRWLDELPERSIVYSADFTELDAALTPPVNQARGLGVDWRLIGDELPRSIAPADADMFPPSSGSVDGQSRAPVTAYYHLSSCSVRPETTQGLERGPHVFERCAQALEAYGDATIQSAELPALPFWWEAYNAPTVTIGLYAME